MGSKAQAKASSEQAKRMKDQGIKRTTTNCPVGCGARISIPLGSLIHNCKGFKRDRFKYAK